MVDHKKPPRSTDKSRQAIQAADAALRMPLVRVASAIFALGAIACILAVWLSADHLYLAVGLTFSLLLAVIELVSVALFGRSRVLRYQLSGAVRATF